MLNRAFSIYNLYHNIVNIITKMVFLSTKFDKSIFYFLFFTLYYTFLTIKVIKSYFIIIYVYKERKSNHLFYKIKVKKLLFL